MEDRARALDAGARDGTDLTAEARPHSTVMNTTDSPETEQARILVVDDDEVSRKSVCRVLTRQGHRITAAREGFQALGFLERERFDVLVTDLVMAEMSGLELLERAKKQNPEIEVIVITGFASISSAIDAIKLGGYHYLEKPFRPGQLEQLVMRAAETVRLRRRVRELEERTDAGLERPQMLGDSREIRNLVHLIRQIAPTDSTVLLTGESGTGKELAAAMIHSCSRRSRGRFLAVNCGAFAEDLLANELFGHEKDAFTGATRTRLGLFESADGGTLLLDEVGDMPLSMQVKLLRAIEEREIMRVGGNTPRPIDVRIIAATNKNLKKAVAAGLFRQDLFYRLNVISIVIPPLRDRREDIPLLAQFFLGRAAKRAGREISRFSDRALQALVEYSFPGNVRELENLVERAVAVARAAEIGYEELPSDLREMDVFPFERPDSTVRTLREVERDYIQWVLRRAGRNKTKAAKLLGIDRSSLWRHLKNCEIDESDDDS